MQSEAVCVVFLQKTCDAKRVYATVVNAKTNADGTKSTGILHPSADRHKILLQKCYHECGVDTNLLEYVEAHGTATKVCFVWGYHGPLFLYMLNHTLTI